LGSNAATPPCIFAPLATNFPIAFGEADPPRWNAISERVGI
jgi:hypothetical protein